MSLLNLVPNEGQKDSPAEEFEMSPMAPGGDGRVAPSTLGSWVTCSLLEAEQPVSFLDHWLWSSLFFAFSGGSVCHLTVGLCSCNEEIGSWNLEGLFKVMWRTGQECNDQESLSAPPHGGLPMFFSKIWEFSFYFLHSSLSIFLTPLFLMSFIFHCLNF